MLSRPSGLVGQRRCTERRWVGPAILSNSHEGDGDGAVRDPATSLLSPSESAHVVGAERRESQGLSGVGGAARRVVLLVVRVVVALNADVREEFLEVDVAARVAEGDEGVAVADAGGFGGAVAVLGVEQGVAELL